MRRGASKKKEHCKICMVCTIIICTPNGLSSGPSSFQQCKAGPMEEAQEFSNLCSTARLF